MDYLKIVSLNCISIHRKALATNKVIGKEVPTWFYKMCESHENAVRTIPDFRDLVDTNAEYTNIFWFNLQDPKISC